MQANENAFRTWGPPPAKILLIEPPFYRFFNYERFHYPVTLTLIATYLKGLGYDVRVYDADMPSKNCSPLTRTQVRDNYPLYQAALRDKQHPIWAETRRAIEDFKPDAVGLTAITAKVDSADLIAEMVRELYGGKVKIVLGGPHAQGMRASDPAYNFGDRYDEIVTGIPGLINLTPDKQLILGIEKYPPKNLYSVLTSAGCPNACTFCCHSFDKATVYRSIDSIREELTGLKTAFGNANPVYIMDDCFFSHTAHFTAVGGLLKELGLKFTAGSRIMSLTPQKIEKFIGDGGTRLYVGVESGSQRVLDRVKKRLRVEEIKKRTKLLNDAGLPWSAFAIAGFPFETLDDLKLTEELLYEVRPTFISLNRFTPYPGTELYNEFFAGSKLNFIDLFQLNRNSCVKLSDEVEDYLERMFSAFDDYNKKRLADAP